jgi:serine/threonine-protein kinase RsbW
MTIHYEITYSAELESLAAFRELVDLACNQEPLIDDQTRYDLKLAVDEACTNIILHGYAGMDPGSIILTIEIEPQAAKIKITDFGHPFEPLEVSLPDLATELGGDPETLGLFFMHQSTDQVDYESSPAGNNLRMVKFLAANHE